MNPVSDHTGGGGALTVWRVLGLLSALAGHMLWSLRVRSLFGAFGLAERYLSPDQHISLGTDYVHQLLMFYGALLLGIGIATALGAGVLSEMTRRLTSSNDYADRGTAATTD